MRSIVRWITLALMAVAVLVATADGFAQSYAGLYGWATEHHVSGWKAESFPLLVDLFIGVGEMGLFLLALDGHKLTKSWLSWVDLMIPGATAAGGWVVSLVFNVGHVKGGHLADQITAAVPPVASMIGLVILLRTLHRYVASTEQAELTVVAATATVDRLTDGHVPGDLPILGEASAVEYLPAPEPAEVTVLDPVVATARERFAETLAAGGLPSVRALRRELRVGHPRATAIRSALADL